MPLVLRTGEKQVGGPRRAHPQKQSALMSSEAPVRTETAKSVSWGEHSNTVQAESHAAGVRIGRALV